MKLPRLLLVLLGSALVLILAVAALAFTPAVQRWAVLRAVRSHPGLKLDIGKLSAGLSSFSVENVRVEQQGAVVTLDRGTGRLGVIDALFGKYSASQVRLEGLKVDLTASKRAPSVDQAGAAPAAIPGFVAHYQMPVAIDLDDLQASGVVMIATAGNTPPMQATFQLTLDRFGPGRDGTVALKLSATPGVPGPVATVRGELSVALAQSRERTFTKADVKGKLEAEGPQVPAGRQLLFESVMLHGPGGDNYSIRMDLAGREDTAARLMEVIARQAPAASRYEGTWKLAMRREQLADFLPGVVLPAFAAEGHGQFTADLATRVGSLQGVFKAEAGELETVNPAWRPLGTLRIDSEFDVAGQGGIAKLNRFHLTLAGDTPVVELQASGAAQLNFRDRRIQLGASAPGEVLRLKLLGLPLAWIRPFVEVADVSGSTITGEVTVTSRTDGQLSAQTVTPLRVDNLSVVQSGRPWLLKGSLAMEAAAEASKEGVQASLQRFEISSPSGEAMNATGQLSMPFGADRALSIDAKFDATAPRQLAQLLPGAPMIASGTAALTVRNQSVEFRPSRIDLRQGKDGTMLSAIIAQTFVVDRSTLAISSAKRAEPIARFEANSVPLALLTVVPGSPLRRFKFGGDLRAASFELLADGTNLSLRASQPVKVEKFALALDGRRYLQDVQVGFQPVIEMAAGHLNKFTLGDVMVRDDGGLAMTQLGLEIAPATDGGMRAALNFNANLPAMAGQPVLASAGALSAGRASGEVRAAIAGLALQVEARATLNGLVLRDGGRALPLANVSVKAVMQPDGKLSVQAPVLLDHAGQRSDLNLTADGYRRGGELRLDAKLSGQQVELNDALALFAIMGAPVGDGADQGAAERRALSPPTADAKPFWSGLAGELAIDLKTVTRGADWKMAGFIGAVTIEPEHLRLTKLAADFGGDSRLAAIAHIDFSPGAEPYALGAEFSLTEFDAGKFLKGADPKNAPIVEGIFSVNGSVAGGGLTLDDLIDRSRGDVQFASHHGVFRGLKRATDKVSTATKVAELGAALGSLLGSTKVTKAAEKVAGQAYAIDQLSQNFAEMPYDQLGARLVRDESLNVRLQDFVLVSPEVRLSGSGQISYAAGKPLTEQPMNLSLALGARGKVEELLGKLKQLDGTRDELDYAKMKDRVTIGGTLSRPNPSEFFTRLALD